MLPTDGVEACPACGATATQDHKDGCGLDGSHYLGREPLPGEVAVTTRPVEPHCRAEQIPLTDAQRKALTVTREVSIPGAHVSGVAMGGELKGKN